MRRVRKRSNRPLLQNADPEGTMRRLMEARHPLYALADLTVDSHEAPHERVVQRRRQGPGRTPGSRQRRRAPP